jgi:hypothetical protein
VVKYRKDLSSPTLMPAKRRSSRVTVTSKVNMTKLNEEFRIKQLAKQLKE